MQPSSPRRSLPRKTAADYLAMALSPVLIMGLVGSLVFFLLDVGYGSARNAGLRWVLFWFVLAAVLISRIAIERGSSYAWIYGVGLGAATAWRISALVNRPLWAWCLLGLIWWWASRLTWDCTLIDDEVDASGEGLLRQGGDEDAMRPEDAHQRRAENPRGPGRSVNAAVREVNASPESGANGVERGGTSLDRPKHLRERLVPEEGKPHAPGLWVVYSSVVALALFGLGESGLPEGDPSLRRVAFRWLLLYLACALGLLVATSFLGLRRYLRQRRLRMPPAIAGTWVPLGAVIAGGMLVFCLLLPRPEAHYSLTAWLDRLAWREKNPAEHGFLKTEARESTEGSHKTATGSEESNNGDSRRHGRGAETKPGASGQNRPAAEGATDQASGHAVRGPAPPGRRLPLRPSWAGWIKALFYGLLGLVLLWGLVRHRKALWAAVCQLWDEWRRFGRGWLGRHKRPGSARGVGEKLHGSRAFHAYHNPFRSGRARKVPTAEVVRYSFEALEAWAEEQGLGRLPDQTPVEFATCLEDLMPDWSEDLRGLTRLYSQLAYAGRDPSPDCEPGLERLWLRMTATAVSR